MSHFRWLAPLLAFILGTSGGLYYAWILDPVDLVDTAPSSLRQDFRENYLTLIALAYAASDDLGRAQTRLALFPDLDPTSDLAALAQKRLAIGGDPSEARALAKLAAAVGGAHLAATGTTDLAATASPALGATLAASATPWRLSTQGTANVPSSALELISQHKLCDTGLKDPLIQIRVTDAAGNPLAGVEILVVWDIGQSRFFTGLKPELGIGYADFSMEAGTTYTLQVLGGGEPVYGLAAEDCPGEGGVFPGSWLLIFAPAPTS